MTVVRKALKTVGLSPKALAAACAPLTTAVGASVASWIVTGNFSDSEIRTAASGVVLSIVAGVAAFVGKPGTVEVVNPATPSSRAGQSNR